MVDGVNFLFQNIGCTLNLFHLHDPRLDTSLRGLIRVRLVPPLRSRLKTICNDLSHHQLDPIDEIVEKFDFKVDRSIVERWLTRDKYIPLVGIQYLLVSLDQIHKLSLNTVKETLKNCTEMRVSTGPQNIIRIPASLSDDILYLAGVIIGDGCLCSATYRINIEKANPQYMRSVFKPLVEKLFRIHINFKVLKRPGKQQTILWIKKCKPLYRLLEKIFEIPRGEKARDARMSSLVRTLSPINRVPFLTGLFDTDWGSYGGTFGTSTASKHLLKDVKETLNKLNVDFTENEYCINGFKSYHLRIARSSISNLREILAGRYGLKNPKREHVLNSIRYREVMKW
jgi:hypothetical protein